MDWMLGASNFAFGVSEYVTIIGAVECTVRSTKPFCSSSFKRRVTVVEDEFTLFLMSVNCRGMFLRSRTMSMCKSLDLLSKLRSLSTCEKMGSHSAIVFLSIPIDFNEVFHFTVDLRANSCTMVKPSKEMKQNRSLLGT